MCATCGCGGEAETTIRNLQTGKVTTMARVSTDHEHGRAHARHPDSAGHNHPHDHGHERAHV